MSSRSEARVRAHAFCQLDQFSSPDGIKTYGYDALGRLERLAFDVNGQGETMVGKLGYDGPGRVAALDYPRPAGMPAFVVKQEHAAYGHVLKVRDANNPLTYTDPSGFDGDPDDRTQSPYVQTIGAFWGGIGLGIVPFAGTGHQVLTDGHVLGRGSPEALRGLAVGQIVGGIFSMVGGVTGEILGGLATTTGIGAALGVPAIVVATPLVLGGAANMSVEETQDEIFQHQLQGIGPDSQRCHGARG